MTQQYLYVICKLTCEIELRFEMCNFQNVVLSISVYYK